MKAAYYVNTMVLMEGRHSRVLCDPWVTFNEESVCDFYNFPPTRLTREAVAAIAPDFIYITHSHPDHFDPATLALFERRTPILIAKFDNPFFEKAIRRLGFTDVRAADPETGLALNGDDRAWLFPAAHAPDVDSIGIFRIDGALSINANDNTFHAAQCAALRQRFGAFDIGFLPFGAHGPYPMFYDNLAPAEKAAKAAERKRAAYASFANYIRALGVGTVVPFAGGLVAGGPKALRYAYSGIGTRSEAVAAARAELEFRPVFLSEGCRHDFAAGRTEGTFVERTYASEADYLARVAAKPTRFDAGGRFHVAPSEQIDLSALLANARGKQAKWQELKKTTSTIAYYLDVGDALLYRLSLADTSVRRVAERDIGDDAYEIFRLPYGLLLGLLTRHYNWSNVKTQYVTYFRKPDRFDRDLHLMMSFLHL
jgi:UDP-MurNAc hydroxylase